MMLNVDYHLIMNIIALVIWRSMALLYAVIKKNKTLIQVSVENENKVLQSLFVTSEGVHPVWIIVTSLTPRV